MGGQPADHLGVYPKDIPLIDGHLRPDQHLMLRTGRDQQNVTGHHMDDLALHQVGHIASDEKIDLIEIVMVQRHILQIQIPFVLQLKILMVHFLPRIVPLWLPLHGVCPLVDGVKAIIMDALRIVNP